MINITKRGMIEVSFNWIFILIAGAIIFVFFLNIVNKQREFSEMKTSGTIVTNLESILTGAQISTGTVNVVDMPKIDIGFDCDRYFIGSSPKQTKGNVIFSPDLLKGKELITWAIDWNLPYRVTNFLYLTDPQVRYVIVYQTGFQDIADEIYGELPEEMNKDLPTNSLATFQDKNNYKVKFVFSGSDTWTIPSVPTSLQGMPNKDVTAIKVTWGSTPTTIPSTGTIEFYQKQVNSWDPKGTTYYLKEESLFGAIFSEDIETYNCVMRKAFKKLNLASSIYVYRAEQLRDYYGNSAEPYYNPNCESAHSSAINPLESIRDLAESRITDFPTILENMNAIITQNTNLRDENQRAQLFSCALIY